MVRKVIGVTGEMGCGKSYVCMDFQAHAEKKGVKVSIIELDKIGHEIHEQPEYVHVRMELADAFSEEILSPDKTTNRKKLADIVFSDKEELDKLNAIMMPRMMSIAEEWVDGLDGLVLFSAALLAESNLTYLCDTGNIIVYCERSVQVTRLHDKGIYLDDIAQRLGMQYLFKEKKDRLLLTGKRLWIVDNTHQPTKAIYNDILAYTGF
jgi:dephospho-CoA kinase